MTATQTLVIDEDEEMHLKVPEKWKYNIIKIHVLKYLVQDMNPQLQTQTVQQK